MLCYWLYRPDPITATGWRWGGSIWGSLSLYCQSKKRLEQWQSSCKKDTFYVEALCTDALHRRQGLAEYLLSLAEKKAKECGLKRMALEVADNNYPAMALYLKCGFTCKDKRRTPCDFTHYECRLWLEKTLSWSISRECFFCGFTVLSADPSGSASPKGGWSRLWWYWWRRQGY